MTSSAPKKHFPAPLLLPATSSDIPTLASIEVLACSPDLLFRLYFANQSVFRKILIPVLEEMISDSKCLIMKAVDPTNKEEIMGWASWNIREKDAGAASENMGIPEKAEDEKGGYGEEAVFDFPFKDGLPAHVHEHTRKVLDEWMLRKRHMLFEGLYTAPKYQRRGVGSALLKWGNERADTEDLPSFLQATAAAYNLYRKMGWKEVKTLDVDLGNWVVGGRVKGGAGWGVYRVRWMVRMPVERDVGCDEDRGQGAGENRTSID